MSQWYLSKNGKAQGPLDEEKIISLIQKGEVGHLDLVFRAGDKEWLPISEVTEFNTHLKKDEPSAKTSEDDADWVLLKKTKGEKGSQYSQLGPFSKDQVLDLIERGEVRFKDFAWRQGLEAWVPIGDVKEFAEPLPSTPQVDKEIYESLPEVTQVDEDVSSMSELIEIEHFEHEKTQVMSVNDIPLNSSDFATETDFNTPSSFSISESDMSDAQITQTNHREPENDDIDHTTDADLWSLRPPETKSNGGEVQSKKTKAKKDKSRVKKQKAKDSTDPSNEKPIFDLTDSPWPWIAAAGILFLSVVFLYMSFSGDPKDVAEKDEVVMKEKVFSLKDIDPKDFEDLSLDIQAPKEEIIEEPVEVVLKPQDDPQLNMGSVPKRKISSRPVAKKKIKAPVQRKIAKKKNKKKKKVAPIKTSVAGVVKSKSFYKQRDRKALFYSSLKVESLITELEQNFKKLKKKKKSWKRFYSKWRKKAKSTLPSLIKKFPEKKSRYAYPRLLASLKRDHHLVLKYGDVYNAKVFGLRRPAGVPKNLKALFIKHKRQAQRLGN